VTVSAYKYPIILEFSEGAASDVIAPDIHTDFERLVFLGPLFYVYPVSGAEGKEWTFVTLDGTYTLRLSESDLSEMTWVWKTFVEESAKQAVESGVVKPSATKTLSVIAVRQGCNTAQPCSCTCGVEQVCTADATCVPYGYPSGRCWVGCHPAAGASIMRYWNDHGHGGLGSDTDAMMVSLNGYMHTGNCGDTTRGNSANGIKAYAADKGYTFDTLCISTHSDCNGSAPTFQQLVNEIDADRPVILAFNGHANTGIGYDTSGQIAILNSNLGNDPKRVSWSLIASYTGVAAAGIITIHPHVPDTTPPTKASNVRPSGWTGPYTSDATPSFRWNAASDSGSGVAGYYVAVDDWTPEGGSGNDWWAGNVTVFTVPDAQSDGEHIFAVTSKDNAGNVNPTNTNQQGDAPYYIFYVDTTAPTNPTAVTSGCEAQDGVWQRDCTDPNFTWSGASDHGGVGIKDYHIYWGIDPNGVPDVWRSTASYDPGIIDTSSGVVTYYLRMSTRDELGHESDPETVFTLRYDGSVPTANPLVAAGAEVVHSLRVSVEPYAQDAGSGPHIIHLSNDGFTWHSEPYAASTTWTLEPLNRRLQIVYLEVEDKAGNHSPHYPCWVCLDLYPAHPSSEGYQLWSAGPIVAGNQASSSNYHLSSTAGQSMMGGDLGSANYRLRSGFQALWPANPSSEMFTPFSCRHWIYLPVTLRGN